MYSDSPSDLRNCLWQVINHTRVLVMREKANVEIAASLFSCKMLIKKKSMVLCVNPTLREKKGCVSVALPFNLQQHMKFKFL